MTDNIKITEDAKIINIIVVLISLDIQVYIIMKGIYLKIKGMKIA